MPPEEIYTTSTAIIYGRKPKRIEKMRMPRPEYNWNFEETEKEVVIAVDNIDSAVENIIGILKGTSTTDVIYFCGWWGLGASAVLKAVVKQLRSSLSDATTRTAMGLDLVIHIDCSLWQSKRGLQRAIAEELELPWSVMATFDQRDKEDDFDGVEEGSRGFILDVTKVILDHLYNRRFLVVFHNGSGSYIDLQQCGIPILGLSSKKVLWTSQGRFQLLSNIDAKNEENEDEQRKKLAESSKVTMFAQTENYIHCFKHLLHAEAREVARYTGIPKHDLSPEVVLECIMYTAQGGDKHGINWGTHAANYWICDGILQATGGDGGRSAWEIGDALQRNMNMDSSDIWKDYIFQEVWHNAWRDRWVSVSHRKVVQVPPQATSFFCTMAPILQAGMFRYSEGSRLRVIPLSYCTFSFSSPPFVGCSNIRFLLLDHCTDNDKAVEQDHDNSHSRHDCVN